MNSSKNLSTISLIYKILKVISYDNLVSYSIAYPQLRTYMIVCVSLSILSPRDSWLKATQLGDEIYIYINFYILYSLNIYYKIFYESIFVYYYYERLLRVLLHLPLLCLNNCLCSPFNPRCSHIFKYK